jgi:hypothetical protein
VAGWVEHYRKFWEESFDRLDVYLQELKRQDGKNQQAPHKEKTHVRKSRKY